MINNTQQISAASVGTTQNNSNNNNNNNVGDVTKALFMTIQNTPIYFTEDWSVGIGGGLWSTGLAMAQYFASGQPLESIEKMAHRKRSRKLSVLELGSGNGFLSVCFAALAAPYIDQLVVTDIGIDHIKMIQQTLRANSHIISLCNSEEQVKEEQDDTESTAGRNVNTFCIEHRWGEFEKIEEEQEVVTKHDNNGQDISKHYNSLEELMRYGQIKFDIIIGSDVAYRKELYDPLIRSLQQFSNSSKTIILIGVTMVDTTPDFFVKLEQSGFVYEKLADHLLLPEFRGTTFGIFIIQKK